MLHAAEKTNIKKNKSTAPEAALPFALFETADTHGLAVLETEAQDFLRRTLRAVTKVSDWYCGVGTFSEADYHSQFQNAIETENSQRFKQLSQRYREAQQAARYYRWQQRVQHALNEEATWEGAYAVLQESAQRERLMQLKKNWQAGERFALHSPDALLYCINAILLALRAYYEAAVREYTKKQKKLPSDFQQKFHTWLIQCNHWLVQWESNLIHAVSTRLALAASGPPVGQADVVFSIQQQLAPYGVKLEAPPAKFAPFYLEDKHVLPFVQLVKTKGTLAQQENLQNLPGLKAAAIEVVSAPDGDTILLPTALQPFVPTKPRFKIWGRFLDWALPHRQTFIEELKQGAALFWHTAHCLADVPPNIPIQAILATDGPLAALKKAHAALDKLAAQEVVPQGRARLFKRKYHAFNAVQQQQCLALQKKLLQQAIVWLKQTAAQLDDKTARTLGETQRHDLKSFIGWFAQHANTEQQEHAETAMTAITNALHQAALFDTQTLAPIFKELEQGILEGRGRLKPIYDIVALLKAQNDPNALQQFHACYSTAFEGALAATETLLAQLSLHDIAPSEAIWRSLVRGVQLIQTCADGPLQAHLQQALMKSAETLLKGELVDPDKAWRSAPLAQWEWLLHKELCPPLQSLFIKLIEKREQGDFAGYKQILQNDYSAYQKAQYEKAWLQKTEQEYAQAWIACKKEFSLSDAVIARLQVIARGITPRNRKQEKNVAPNSVPSVTSSALTLTDLEQHIARPSERSLLGLPQGNALAKKVLILAEFEQALKAKDEKGAARITATHLQTWGLFASKNNTDIDCFRPTASNLTTSQTLRSDTLC